MATSQDINSLFQSTLGRSADKGGLDYYTRMANERGMDWVRNSLSGSDEAKQYKSSGNALTVKDSDRASGISYRSPSTSSSSSRTSSTSVNNLSDQLNSIYQQNLGRSLDKGGLDYYSKMAQERGIDWVRDSIANSDEARLYQQRGTGLTVSALDQVGGFNYRNAQDVASQQAMNQEDYGLLSSAMQKGVEQGRFTPVQDAQGNTLFRSANGGLYNIAGMPVQERPTSSVPQTSVTRNQTSQGQLHQMLDSNSPLMRQAATMGLQRANQRGLLNSSMASQAAQGAMIDRATPFAQQDAQTYFQNSQANANRQQQAYMSDLQYRQQLGLNQQQYGFQTGLNQQQYGFDMNRLQASSTANAWGVMSNNITDIVAQSMDAINNIQANPNITADNKASMIEQILDMRDTDIAFQSSLYESLSGYLADTGLFPNL